ncbi:MAG: hypothetical protein WAO71_06295, partial [Gallionella sp.]
GRVENRLSPALPHQTVHALTRTRLSDVLHAKACTFHHLLTHAIEKFAFTLNFKHVRQAIFCLVLAHSFLVTSWGEQHDGNPLTLGFSVA